VAGAHVVVVGAWLGALARFAVCLGGAPDTQASSPLVRPGVSRVAVLLLAIVGATVLAAARAVDGWPALVGTRYGRWLLLQSALLAVTVAVVAVAHLGAWRAGVDAARSPDADPSTPRAGTRRCLGRVLAIEIAVGAAMVVAAAMLAGLAGAAEPTRWPFGFRPAPGVMLRSPGAVDRVISATAIALIGVLALVGAWRFKGGRPLLLAGGAMFLAIGLYQALAAMSIDAYPTTYARPAVAADAESIRRGHALFATRCAACHGRTGRGDGPAGAGLLQRPAD
jgi:putative copper resistance protein D